MDEKTLNLPNQNQIQSKQQSPKQKILFIGVVVFSMLVILLLVLNYFNIIKLSGIFPNYLGFLPHKSYEEIKDKKPTYARQGFPTPDPSSLSESAKQKLIAYLPTILDSSLLATSSSDITFLKEEATEGFSAFWNTKENGTAKAVFFPSSAGNSINSLIFAFHKAHSDAPSKEVAENIVPKSFLVEPKGQWACANILDGKRLYCENFWEEENGIRRGVGLQGYRPDSTSKISTILFCEFTKDSASYSWKSCASEFAKTGIKP